MIRYEQLNTKNAALLNKVRAHTFDNAIDPEQTAAFLADPCHEMVVAHSSGEVMGFASGTIMLHPDKPPAFFISEVGVHEDYRRQGIATELSQRLIQVARNRGCKGIWLATEQSNIAARALYRCLEARETADVVVYDWDGLMDDHPTG